MTLLNEHLSAWEIAHRWAGYDPSIPRLIKPLAVRDNFRLLLDAILHSHLYCLTLDIAKWHPESDSSPEDHIRYHLDDIEQCIHRGRCKRKLLKWAVIDRYDFMTWCERQGIPLPEFWFPPGWKIDYEWPDDVMPEDVDAIAANETAHQSREETPQDHDKRLRNIQKQKIACQFVAGQIWKNEPTLDIKQVANRPEIQNACAGSEREFETIAGWLGEVDPRNPANKRGRRRKNNSGGRPE